MYVHQKQLNNVHKLLQKGKVIVIYGPRRCGKTTLLKAFLKTYTQKTLMVSGEDINVQNYLSSQSIEKLKIFIGDAKLLVIDEAQKINNIGLNLKLIVDHIENISIIATGSSAFDLAKNIGEPLTGRKITLKLYPFSQIELNSIENRVQIDSLLESRLIYGSYPEIVLAKDNNFRQRYLKELIESYLYKDILELDGIRYSGKIIKLLQLLAFQIGKEVSFNELGTQLGMSKNTVNRYLGLLEKTFVIQKLNGFSRNLRKEITKNPRFYFIDTGIRNALINNFNSLDMRNDIGELWENYIIMERLKKQEYFSLYTNNYFWRTYNKNEVDLVEEYEGKLHGYEIKWKQKKSKPPALWKLTYPTAEYKEINSENYLDFIC
ncbi:MAG: AAA family ATPase [Chlamydiae bacterium]|nr:MAG: AAA family ATPase [Chlamydiota bacterium]